MTRELELESELLPIEAEGVLRCVGVNLAVLNCLDPCEAAVLCCNLIAVATADELPDDLLDLH